MKMLLQMVGAFLLITGPAFSVSSDTSKKEPPMVSDYEKSNVIEYNQVVSSRRHLLLHLLEYLYRVYQTMPGVNVYKVLRNFEAEFNKKPKDRGYDQKWMKGQGQVDKEYELPNHHKRHKISFGFLRQRRGRTSRYLLSLTTEPVVKVHKVPRDWMLLRDGGGYYDLKVSDFSGESYDGAFSPVNKK